MIEIRRADDRGHYQNDWLDSRHTFSFGEYYDPKHTGVSVLRVINDDRVVAGAGFPTHPHKNMEIVSYVLEGELAHKDSMGNGSVIKPGDVQRMSAGRGVTHSEFNPSDSAGTNFLQIWLLPSEQDVDPGYEQKYFSAESRQGVMKLLLSPDGKDGSIRANTDASMFGSLLEKDQSITYTIEPGRIAYVHVAKGAISIDGAEVNQGDGATIKDQSEIRLVGNSPSEVLVFDLPH